MSIWHRLTHWLMSDMLTLEERELIAEQARRQKLRVLRNGRPDNSNIIRSVCGRSVIFAISRAV